MFKTAKVQQRHFKKVALIQAEVVRAYATIEETQVLLDGEPAIFTLYSDGRLSFSNGVIFDLRYLAAGFEVRVISEFLVIQVYQIKIQRN